MCGYVGVAEVLIVTEILMNFSSKCELNVTCKFNHSCTVPVREPHMITQLAEISAKSLINLTILS